MIHGKFLKVTNITNCKVVLCSCRVAVPVLSLLKIAALRCISSRTLQETCGRCLWSMVQK